MSIEVKVGQVWRDKDKRRNTAIEVLSVIELGKEFGGDTRVIGLIVGTEEERDYKASRLIERWSLVSEKAEKLAEKPKHKTREAWLEAAVKALTKSVFKDYEVPNVRVSVGWPSGRGKKTGVMGQCFATKSADDKVSQIFVSPACSDPYAVVETVAHELVHTIDDCESGHKKNFIKIAREVGFLPPWKSTPADDTLREKIEQIVESLGTYPHAAIRVEDRPTVQKTYMVKIVPSVECDECDPEYKLRMTQKWLEEAGAPLCPHGVEMVEG